MLHVLFQLFELPDAGRAAAVGLALEAGQLDQVGLKRALDLLVRLLAFLREATVTFAIFSIIFLMDLSILPTRLLQLLSTSQVTYILPPASSGCP